MNTKFRGWKHLRVLWRDLCWRQARFSVESHCKSAWENLWMKEGDNESALMRVQNRKHPGTKRKLCTTEESGQAPTHALLCEENFWNSTALPLSSFSSSLGIIPVWRRYLWWRIDIRATGMATKLREQKKKRLKSVNRWRVNSNATYNKRKSATMTTATRPQPVDLHFPAPLAVMKKAMIQKRSSMTAEENEIQRRDSQRGTLRKEQTHWKGSCQPSNLRTFWASRLCGSRQCTARRQEFWILRSWSKCQLSRKRSLFQF